MSLSLINDYINRFNIQFKGRYIADVIVGSSSYIYEIFLRSGETREVIQTRIEISNFITLSTKEILSLLGETLRMLIHHIDSSTLQYQRELDANLYRHT